MTRDDIMTIKFLCEDVDTVCKQYAGHAGNCHTKYLLTGDQNAKYLYEVYTECLTRAQTSQELLNTAKENVGIARQQKKATLPWFKKLFA